MVVLGPRPLTVDEVVAVARDREPVDVDPGVRDAMAPGRAVVDAAVAAGRTVYGVTTGFGALATTRIDPADAERVQHALVQSHAAGMLAHLCLALRDLDVLLATVDVACAMSVEALRATDAAFAERVCGLRPHPGAVASAANLRRLLAGSPIVASHRDSEHAVQDAYSIRCAPQVHGAARDVIAWVRSTVEVELGSVTDNPVVFAPSADEPAGAVLSTGNFHGQPLAFAADFACIALADLAAIVERRIDRLMDPVRSDGLPPFLAPEA